MFVQNSYSKSENLESVFYFRCDVNNDSLLNLYFSNEAILNLSNSNDVKTNHSETILSFSSDFNVNKENNLHYIGFSKDNDLFCKDLNIINLESNPNHSVFKTGNHTLSFSL